MKILGIDHHVNINKLVGTIAKSEGHGFTGVDNVKDGLKLIREEKFDVVLLDLVMPEISGFEVIDTLAKEGIIKKQPIIIFTASSKPDEELQQLVAKGAHSFIRKPVKIKDLINKIRKIELEKSK